MPSVARSALIDHARQCVVRTGRTSSSLGRKTDLLIERVRCWIALTCEVGGSPSEPRSHDRGHVPGARRTRSSCSVVILTFDDAHVVAVALAVGGRSRLLQSSGFARARTRGLRGHEPGADAAGLYDVAPSGLRNVGRTRARTCGLRGHEPGACAAGLCDVAPSGLACWYAPLRRTRGLRRRAI